MAWRQEPQPGASTLTAIEKAAAIRSRIPRFIFLKIFLDMQIRFGMAHGREPEKYTYPGPRTDCAKAPGILRTLDPKLRRPTLSMRRQRCAE
jgi:hypothetical protein